MRTTLKLSLAAIFIISAIKIYAQDDMMSPKPVDNKVLEGMIGEWTGEADMMGMKYQEDVKNYWTLNHQYMIMEVKDISKDNPKMTYGGMGIIGVDKDGNAKMWWFDDGGAEMMATGSGTFTENKLSVKSTNPKYTDERSFELKDGNIICIWESSMRGKEGEEMKMNGKTIYTKK